MFSVPKLPRLPRAEGEDAAARCLMGNLALVIGVLAFVLAMFGDVPKDVPCWALDNRIVYRALVALALFFIGLAFVNVIGLVFQAGYSPVSRWGQRKPARSRSQARSRPARFRTSSGRFRRWRPVQMTSCRTCMSERSPLRRRAVSNLRRLRRCHWWPSSKTTPMTPTRQRRRSRASVRALPWPYR